MDPLERIRVEYKKRALRNTGRAFLYFFIAIIVLTYMHNSHYETVYNNSYNAWEARVAQIEESNALRSSQYEAEQTATENYKKNGTVLVNYTFETHQTNYESIGNELIYTYQINGVDVGNSGTIPISVSGGTTTIFSKVVEEEKIPDVGTDSTSKVFTLDEIKQGYVITNHMSAHETRGRDAGNTATFETTCKLNIDPANIPAETPTELKLEQKPSMPVQDYVPYYGAIIFHGEVYGFLSVIALLALLLSVIIINVRSRKECTAKIEYERHREELERLKAEVRREQLEKERASLLTRLKGKTIEDLAGAPPGTYFINGLPVDNKPGEYGSFTVYLSRSGKKYHKKEGCHGAFDPRHIFRIYRYEPCSSCCNGITKRNGDPDWLKEYKRIIDDCKRLNIPIEEHTNQAPPKKEYPAIRM